MNDPSEAEISQALDALPRLPQVRAVLNASMDPMTMVALGSESEKYQMDSDFHLLLDQVYALLTTITDLQGQIENLLNKEKE